MDANISNGSYLIPVGTAQRIAGLSAVKTITLAQGEGGLYLQAISQNVRMTIDGSAPVASGNDLGFQITPAMGVFFFPGFPGMTLKFIQEAASAVIQYQMLKEQGR